MSPNLNYTVNYQSAGLTIFLTLIFLLVTLAPPIVLLNTVFKQLGAGRQILFFILTLFFSLFLAIAATLSAKLLLDQRWPKTAAEITVADDIFHWRQANKNEQKINLKDQYQMWIGVNPNSSDTGTSLLLEGILIYEPYFSKTEALATFPAPYYINKNNFYTPQMYGYGATLPDTQEAKQFFTSFLKILWTNRSANQIFNLYQKYPWGDFGQPEFNYVKIIDWQKRTPEEEKLVKEILNKTIVQIDDLVLAPPYLIGYKYRSADMLKESLQNKKPDAYSIIIMPLGHISAGLSLPKTTTKTYFGINILTRIFGRPATYAPQTTQNIILDGRDQNNQPVQYDFTWPAAQDQQFYESEIFLQFINKNH